MGILPPAYINYCILLFS